MDLLNADLRKLVLMLTPVSNGESREFASFSLQHWKLFAQPTKMKTTYKNTKILKAHLLKTILIAGAMVAANNAALANPTLPSIPSGTYNITSYGASTSSTNNAAAIQSCINAAAAAGVGTVQVPSGTFLSGPITLKSKINLNLASGATLRMLPYGTYPGNTAFIEYGGLTNVEISGSGSLMGRGRRGGRPTMPAMGWRGLACWMVTIAPLCKLPAYISPTRRT